MLKTAFLLSLVLLSAQAKTRKGPFPAKVWEKLRNEPLVDEDESKIVGGTDVEDLSERPYQVSKLYRYSYLKKLGISSKILFGKIVTKRIRQNEPVTYTHVTLLI